MPHQVLPLRAELVVFAAERHDAGFTPFAGQLGHAVAVQAGAVDQEIAFEVAGGRLRHPTLAGGPQAQSTRAPVYLGAARGQQLRGQRLADPRVIHDAFLRDAQRRHAAHVRLDLAHLLAAQPAQAFEAVGSAALLEAAQTRHFAFIGRHHQLAADLVRHTMLLAECHHLADSGYRQPRFSRAGLVIETAVQDAAVVAGLVPPDSGLLFEQSDARAGKALSETVRGRQADDAAADDDHLF